MRYATAAAFRAALEQRLLTRARQSSLSIVRLRRSVAFDRLLARLLATSPDAWVLKGGFALDLRLGDRARATKDIDLARSDTEADVTGDLLAVQSINLGDYFSFAVRRTDSLDAALEGAAVRYRATAELAGRRFEEVTVDIGFGNPIVAAPEALLGSTLLTFAGIEPIWVPTLSLEQRVAEKVHALTRTYPGDRPSSREKDLIDLALISTSRTFNAAKVGEALSTVFAGRADHPLPTTFPPPPPAWGSVYARLAHEVGLDRNVETGYRQAAAFLNPILDGTASDDARWEPGAARWT